MIDRDLDYWLERFERVMFEVGNTAGAIDHPLARQMREDAISQRLEIIAEREALAAPPVISDETLASIRRNANKAAAAQDKAAAEWAGEWRIPLTATTT